MQKNIFDIWFNGTIGFLGASFTLDSTNTTVGIVVGLLTAAYIAVKIYYTIKNKGK